MREAPVQGQCYLIALDNYTTQIAALASGICTVTNTELVSPSL